MSEMEEENYDDLFKQIKNKERKEKKENIKEQYDSCNKCSSTELINKDGFMICQDCGNECYDVITETPEWRDYGFNDTKQNISNRCSSSNCILLVNGKNNSKKNMYKNMYIWFSTNYKENTMKDNESLMRNTALNFNINNCIIDDAKMILREIKKNKYQKKCKKEALIAACIQWAFKKKGVPRDTVEMANMFGITKQDMRKGFKQFEELLFSLEKDNTKDNIKDLISIDFLSRKCSELKLSEDITKMCIEVCIFVESEEYLIKHIPLSRTASSIYFTCNILNININKNEFILICDISEVTINKCYQKLLKFKADIIMNTALNNYFNSV
jgi:transcription initiation factor TFIIIB Brf1 subunit/transcription initiation factor TFIIB